MPPHTHGISYYRPDCTTERCPGVGKVPLPDRDGREKTSGDVGTVAVSVKDDPHSSRSTKMLETISTSRTA